MNSSDNIDLYTSIRLICKPSKKKVIGFLFLIAFFIPIFPRINLVAAKDETKEPQKMHQGVRFQCPIPSNMMCIVIKM